MEGDPKRNLATFVTTWMEPEAQRIIAENLHRNFIDHAEYPISAEIEQRCVRMLADLFHAPGRDDRLPDPGLLRGDHARRAVPEVEVEASAARGGRALDDEPNLVFGGDVHVVWEKFCRYFDVEPRIVPLAEGKYTIGPEDVAAAPRREHHRRGRGARDDVHRPHGRHRRDQRAAGRPAGAGPGPRRPHPRGRRQRRVRLALPLPRLRLGLPSRAGPLDQRLRSQVRARLPRHRLAGLPRDSPTSPRTWCSTRTTSASSTRPSP